MKHVLHFSVRALIFLAASFVLAPGSFAQKTNDHSGGRPVLWERVNVRGQDLFLGPGGHEMQPDLSAIKLVREEKGGHSKKYRIKDGNGNTWVAKVGDEAQSETAAVRLLAAIGYKTEINYLVPRLTIPGAGTFSNVRLEARPDDVDRGKEWKWGKTPFEDTREMHGLMLMMAFLNNWDMKSANNVLVRTDDETRYVISDLGVSFGKTGSNPLPIFWRIGRSRNDPEDFSKSKLVRDVRGNRVSVQYNGKNRSRMRDFTIDDARWLANLLSQLRDSQIRDAFRAANYSRHDIDLLSRSVRERIEQLRRAGAGLKPIKR